MPFLLWEEGLDGTATRACPSCAYISAASRVNPTCDDKPGHDESIILGAVQIASDRDEKLKSFTSSGGVHGAQPSNSPARVRSLGPLARTFASTAIGLSLKRKLSVGPTIRPFSIRKLPSRVSPVSSSVCGSTVRMYHSRVTSTPYLVARIMSSIDVDPPAMTKLRGRETGSRPFCCAQKRE